MSPRSPGPRLHLAARDGTRFDPFIDVPAAAQALGTDARSVIGLVRRGDLFGLGEPDAPFGVRILRSDIERRLLTVSPPAA